MDKKFRVNVLTPYGKYLSTEADYLSVLTGSGVIGILPNHAPLITTVEISKLTITLGNEKKEYAVSGGLLHIKEGTDVVLMVNAIERSDEIDIERAKRAKERADNRLNNVTPDIGVVRAKAALARALNRISISESE